MEPQKTDQEQFDESVNRIGKVVLQVLAGVGIFAAVLMSLVALLNSGQTTTVRTIASGQPAAPVRATVPSSARIMIDHVLRGCHNLAVNGGAPDSPRATLHLAVGGRLLVQNNDVMPHRLFLRSGPSPTLATPMMNHMGAGSTVTFGKPGVYMLGTKPGEDYTKGIVTIGADHVLRIKVIVS
jgi:hypothetical protein